jgi:hypothetical protein
MGCGAFECSFFWHMFSVEVQDLTQKHLATYRLMFIMHCIKICTIIV